MLKGNALIAQSGGPTAVINSSVCGAVQTWLNLSEQPGTIYAAVSGIKGFLEEDLIDLAAQDPAVIDAVKWTPGAGLFSCRYKVSEEEYPRLVEICQKYDIRYFFYNGGNDSMDTCNKMSIAAEKLGYEMRVIGIPKTVDNDLPITDHCPGYASAAKYLAATVMECGIDLASVATKNKVCIIEAMGRNAGWLTAAAALAKRYEVADDGTVRLPANTADDAPHLICLPEVPFDTEQFLQDVQAVYDRLGHCFVVASEGIMDKDGNYIAADGKVDAFGHVQLSGAGETLKNLVEERLGLKARCNTLGTAQRSAAHFASKTDADEAYATGKRAVELAIEGKTGVMVTLDRQPGEPYVCTLGEALLSNVANVEKKVPREWINAAGNFVTDDFIRYAQPLIAGTLPVPTRDGLPCYTKIDATLGRVKK